MNLAKENLLHCSATCCCWANQGSTLFVGTRWGYAMFSLADISKPKCEQLNVITARRVPGGVQFLSACDDSSLLCVSSLCFPDSLLILDITRNAAQATLPSRRECETRGPCISCAEAYICARRQFTSSIKLINFTFSCFVLVVTESSHRLPERDRNSDGVEAVIFNKNMEPLQRFIARVPPRLTSYHLQSLFPVSCAVEGMSRRWRMIAPHEEVGKLRFVEGTLTKSGRPKVTDHSVPWRYRGTAAMALLSDGTFMIGLHPAGEELQLLQLLPSVAPIASIGELFSEKFFYRCATLTLARISSPNSSECSMKREDDAFLITCTNHAVMHIISVKHNGVQLQHTVIGDSIHFPPSVRVYTHLLVTPATGSHHTIRLQLHIFYFPSLESLSRNDPQRIVFPRLHVVQVFPPAARPSRHFFSCSWEDFFQTTTFLHR